MYISGQHKIGNLIKYNRSIKYIGHRSVGRADATRAATRLRISNNRTSVHHYQVYIQNINSFRSIFRNKTITASKTKWT